MTRGNCRSAEPTLFHSERQGNGAITDMRLAVRMHCNNCPVVRQCLQYALDNMTEDEARGIYGIGKYGVWGGTLPAQRASMRRGAAA